MANTKQLFERRRRRVRTQISKKGGGAPRLSIHRSGRHIYAQIIDDTKGTTLASASTLDKALKGKAGCNKIAASSVGKLIGERGKKAGVEAVVFDRGGSLYHGKVKALADAAREAGLKF